MKIKKGGKILLLLLIALAVGFGLVKWQNRPRVVGDAKSIGKVAIPDAPEASLSGTAAVKVPLPTTKLSDANATAEIDWQMMAWQSQNGALLANGGTKTTKGSLFE